MTDIDYIKSKLRAYPDFPKKGILFQDIFPIFRDPIAVEKLITHIINYIHSLNELPNVIVGLDSRGFLLGPLISLRLGISFVPVRKIGKLPGPTITASYEKEYGIDEFEMQADSISSSDKVIILDDLIATGGSAHATEKLVNKMGGKILKNIFIIELTELNGIKNLNAPTYSLIQF